jgi:hypothetical protein
MAKINSRIQPTCPGVAAGAGVMQRAVSLVVLAGVS